ncbi:hypothetical protein SDC9_210768 [bioreactor metagenome]|uniref:Uncharacterized protein n=1 Tax=bioreactor metagenome TaxID=1076179 RepID=A0A645JSE6_9ZZZZ
MPIWRSSGLSPLPSGGSTAMELIGCRKELMMEPSAKSQMRSNGFSKKSTIKRKNARVDMFTIITQGAN